MKNDDGSQLFFRSLMFRHRWKMRQWLVAWDRVLCAFVGGGFAWWRCTRTCISQQDWLGKYRWSLFPRVDSHSAFPNSNCAFQQRLLKEMSLFVDNASWNCIFNSRYLYHVMTTFWISVTLWTFIASVHISTLFPMPGYCIVANSSLWWEAW